MALLAATDVNLVDDFDIDDFDVVLQTFDREFRRGGAYYYSAIFSDADIVSHCRHGCQDGDGDDAAAAAVGWLLADDDGPLAPAAGDADTDAEAMSAYVAELERFLLEDDDAPCCEQEEVDQGLLGVVDDYFAGDHQLLSPTVEVVPAAGRAEPTDREEEENADVLAAREDEQSASRKRARNKIMGTPWREPEAMDMMLMHLAQIPAAPWPTSFFLKRK